MNSLILATATRYLLPLLLLFSLVLLFRGHNDPGGGFVGGLTAAAAFVLCSLAWGTEQARRAAGVRPRMFIAVGLLLAISSGVIPLLAGRPFLTGMWTDVRLAGIGTPGTPLLFDIGVYLVVLGVALLIVFTLQEN